MATHQQQQHAQTQAQKAPPPIDWLSFPEPAVVDAPHPDLFDFELDNSLSAFDQAQVQLLTLDYQTDAFQYFRSETPQQGPPSVITASSESAYETLSQHSESLYNYSNTSPSNYGVDQPTYSTDLGLDFSTINFQTTDVSNMPSIASLLDHRRDSSSNYSFSGRSGYDVSASRSTYSASGAYVPASGIAPLHTAGQRAGSAGDSPKSSDGHSLTGDNDPRKKYACPNCTRCKSQSRLRPHHSNLTARLLTGSIFDLHSLCPCIQLEDAHGDARLAPPQALRLLPPRLRPLFQPQARPRPPPRQHPPRRDRQPVLGRFWPLDCLPAQRVGCRHRYER